MLNPSINVHDGDAILMVQRLDRELGLTVGISSGANLLGAITVQQILQGNDAVITIFSDNSKKYLSTDLMKTEPLKVGYLTPEIHLTGYRTINKNQNTTTMYNNSFL